MLEIIKETIPNPLKKGDEVLAIASSLLIYLIKRHNYEIGMKLSLASKEIWIVVENLILS